MFTRFNNVLVEDAAVLIDRKSLFIILETGFMEDNFLRVNKI